jgi:hypothetical protein
MKQFYRQMLGLLVISISTGLGAQQSLQLEGTSITGNKELPMVLYIVPWKSVQRFDITVPPITSIMDQKLEPIDRASFKRTIDYHQAIFSKANPVTPAID